jgi:hypothetical protein
MPEQQFNLLTIYLFVSVNHFSTAFFACGYFPGFFSAVFFP